MLHDTVTLRHFAAVARLDVPESETDDRPEPRWTSEVRSEVERASSAETHCHSILSAEWLGEPIEAGIEDLEPIFDLQVRLNLGRNPPSGDRGEAESIHFAMKLGADFATDDNAAYDFAERQLGPGRVLDSVHIIRRFAVNGRITDRAAADLAESIRASGRHLRRCHPSPLRAVDF